MASARAAPPGAATAYRRGRSWEYRVRDRLRAAGWVVWRAAGWVVWRTASSRSPADLIAGHGGRWALVQVRRRPAIDRAAWLALWSVATATGAEAWWIGGREAWQVLGPDPRQRAPLAFPPAP